MLNRRQFLAAGLGVAGAAVSASALVDQVWPLLDREDLVPGAAPELSLDPQAWRTTPNDVTFAVLGDSGSGGRQAMAVASRMALTYQRIPFGLVTLLGDICYYGKITDRFEDVFIRPMNPLIDAGVRFELAVGNHDDQLHHTDVGAEQIEDELRLLGSFGTPTDAYHFQRSHGPVDLFYLDSSVPGLFGEGSSDQLAWLDDALSRSRNQWRIVALHHPPYSSGKHGSTPGAQERLVPILNRHQVDLVLAGHDHHYERTHPLDGVTYVVSGGGCKTTEVGRSRFTAAADRILEFLLVEVHGDALVGRCIRPDGAVADRFELRARR